MRVTTLLKMYRKNAGAYLPHRTVYKVLLFFAVLGILVPCALAVGFISYVMTEALMEAGHPAGGMLFEMQILSVFSLVFGVWVVFSAMFFPSDSAYLMTLPVPPQELLVSKFIFSYIAESSMTFFMLFSVYVGYFLAMKEYGVPIGAISLISAALGCFLVPLIPMVMCTLFAILITAFAKGLRSANAFFNTTTVLIALFAGLFLYSLKGLGEINIDNYVQVLGSGGDLFLCTLNRIFPATLWLSEAVCESDALKLIMFLLANLAALGVLYLAGCTLFNEGLYCVAALGGSGRAGIKDRELTARGSFLTGLLKELKVLFRTKAFANNCVYVNLIVPAGALGLLHFTHDKGAMADFIRLYGEGKGRAALLLTIVMMAVAFITTAMNSVASTAFTREGAHLELVRFIPVSFEEQVLVKAAVSFVITYPVLLATDIIICYYMRASVFITVYYALIMLLAHVIAVGPGMVLDSASPYVVWEDEYSALRGNVNTFFNMAVMMLLAAFMALVSFGVYELLRAELWIYYSIIFLLFFGAGTASFILGILKKTVENIEAW